MIFGLSTGCCFKFQKSRNKNDVISLYKNTFGNYINAIELIIPEKKIGAFKLSFENSKWLRSLNHVSLHLLNSYQANLKLIKIANKLPRIDKIICHIDNKNNIPEFYYQKYKHKIIVENIEVKYDFEDIFRICFDVPHALTYGEKEFKKFIFDNEPDFEQIHLSGFDKICHTPLYKKESTLKMVNKNIDLKEFPIIVESVCDNIEELKKEIIYIKENV